MCKVFVCFLFICNNGFHIRIQEFQPAGEYNLAGVHLGGMEDTRALEKVNQYKLYTYTVHLGAGLIRQYLFVILDLLLCSTILFLNP